MALINRVPSGGKGSALPSRFVSLSGERARRPHLRLGRFAAVRVGKGDLGESSSVCLRICRAQHSCGGGSIHGRQQQQPPEENDVSGCSAPGVDSFLLLLLLINGRHRWTVDGAPLEKRRQTNISLGLAGWMDSESLAAALGEGRRRMRSTRFSRRLVVGPGHYQCLSGDNGENLRIRDG